jgi:hypothetical protein
MVENNTQPNDGVKPPQEDQSETTEDVTSFHPVQLPEEQGDKLQENEQKIQELMQKIDEESSRLGEFLATENKLMIDLCASLAQVLKKLNLSFSIPPRDLPLKRKTKKAVLNEEGYLKLLYEGEEEKSAFLAEYSPEIVTAVLWAVMPELTRVITLHRKKISTRISFFEAMKSKLKIVVNAVIGNNEERTAPKPDTPNEIPKTEKQS